MRPGSPGARRCRRPARLYSSATVGIELRLVSALGQPVADDPCGLGSWVPAVLLQDQRELLANESGPRRPTLLGRGREERIHFWLERDRGCLLSSECHGSNMTCSGVCTQPSAGSPSEAERAQSRSLHISWTRGRARRGSSFLATEQRAVGHWGPSPSSGSRRRNASTSPGDSNAELLVEPSSRSQAEKHREV